MKLETVGRLAAAGAWWEPVLGLAGAALILFGLPCLLEWIKGRRAARAARKESRTQTAIDG